MYVVSSKAGGSSSDVSCCSALWLEMGFGRRGGFGLFWLLSVGLEVYFTGRSLLRRLYWMICSRVVLMGILAG